MEARATEGRQGQAWGKGKGVVVGLLLLGVIVFYSGCGMEEQGTMEEEGRELEKFEPVLGEEARGPREPTGLRLEKAGWTYGCMDCHKSIEARWRYDRPMVEHNHIELRHGTNSFCLNCHHPENRNAYVHYDGTQIDAESVELLCRKCHGPQYRDWQRGVHGRVNGHWTESAGVKVRLQCIQCHDPHDPAFKSMDPMAAPTYPARAAGRKGKAGDLQREGTNHG